MKHVVVTAPFPQPLLDKIQAVSERINLEQIDLPGNQWPAEQTTDAEIIYTVGGVPRPELAPNLRWVQAHTAGVNFLAATPLWDSDILITNASGIHAPNMAQYTLAQLLAWANRIPRWLQYQQKKEWATADGRWDYFVPQELRGRTIGIVGYGSIGREIARLTKAFGMKVLASKRDARHPEDSGYSLNGLGDPQGILPDRIYPGEAVRSMVAECDYVVLTLPLTEKTHHLVDETVLKEMKETAVLINIGRGDLIKEADLVKALKKGWIAGAGLDVFATEPLPTNNPLWSLDNVILTPHISGFTPHYDERAVNLFAENLRRYLAGEPLLNQVSREHGY